MSLVTIARDALKDLPVSDIVRERLSLALDRLSDAEAKIETFQTQVGSLTAQLERECADHQQADRELQRLKEEHAEEVRIHRSVEFRRGQRTGGKWAVFCPKCHLPAAMPSEHGQYLSCSDGSCHWASDISRHEVEQFIRHL